MIARLSAALVTLVVACGNAPAPAPSHAEPAPSQAASAAVAPRHVDIGALEDKLRGDDDIVLIDVRTPGEFASGHVAGARNIPLNEFPGHVEELKALGEPEIWLICQSGRRSAIAADVLGKAGVSAVNVKGGTGAWRAAGKPVE